METRQYDARTTALQIIDAVANYGAKSDGVTDNTAIFEQIKTDVGANTVVVFLRPGTYVVNPVFTSPDNIEYVGNQAAFSGVDVRISRLRFRSDSVDIREFGASASADAAANTTAMHAAFDLAVSLGVPAYVPNGEFTHDPLTTPDGLQIDGLGTLILSDAADTHQITASGVLTVKNITLDGNKTAQTLAVGDGPDLINTNFVVHLENVTLQNGQRYGIFCVGGHGSSVRRCHANNMLNTVWFFKNADRVTMMECDGATSNVGHVIAFHDLCRDGVIGDNILYTGAANKFGIEVWTNTDGSSPSGILITSNVVNGQSLGGGISLSYASGCVVANNRIRNCISVASIELAQGATGNIVEGNSIENSYRIAVTGTDARRLSGNVVRNNRFKNPIKNGASGGQGIYVLKADECTVEFNEITGALGHTIELSDAQDNHFVGNVLRSGALSGFYLGNSNGNLFERNHLADYTTVGRYAFQLALASETPLNHIRRNTADNVTSFISAFTNTDVADNSSAMVTPLTGTVTLAANVVTQVNNGNVTGKSRIFLTPTNAAAAGLSGVYVAEIASGSYFNIRHAAAAGTETFNYQIR